MLPKVFFHWISGHVRPSRLLINLWAFWLHHSEPHWCLLVSGHVHVFLCLKWRLCVCVVFAHDLSPWAWVGAPSSGFAHAFISLIFHPCLCPYAHLYCCSCLSLFMSLFRYTCSGLLLLTYLFVKFFVSVSLCWILGNLLVLMLQLTTSVFSCVYYDV